MKLVFAIMTALLTQFVFAQKYTQSLQDENHRPASFEMEGKRIVFADFLSAHYFITYDMEAKTAVARTELTVNQVETGFPVIDLIETPTSITINNESVTSQVIKTPKGETSLRFLKQSLTPGHYKIVIENPIKTLVTFQNEGVHSAFWYTDLKDRFFLERFVPANFEFDRLSMVFHVKFLNQTKEQKIYSNGDVLWLDASSAMITYPGHFTSSSIFFHTAAKDSFIEKHFSYASKDGRVLPVTVYTKSSEGTLNTASNQVVSILNELEADYMAFPHNKIVVYVGSPGMGLGGMEYCGATITELSALSHELFHSYVGRGLMPADGNAGWIDEALASWRDNKYPEQATLSGTSSMSSHAPYTRLTDTKAYSFGANFMAYLHGKLKDQGGLKPFLRSMLSDSLFKPYFVPEFVEKMEKFYGIPFMPEFKKYTYGTKAVNGPEPKGLHPIHRKMSLKELEQML